MESRIFGDSIRWIKKYQWAIEAVSLSYFESAWFNYFLLFNFSSSPIDWLQHFIAIDISIKCFNTSSSILSMNRHDTPFNISNANILKIPSQKIDYRKIQKVDGASCKCFSIWLAKLLCRQRWTLQHFCSSLLVIQSCNVKHERVNLRVCQLDFSFLFLIIFVVAVVELNLFFLERVWNLVFVFAK